MTDARDPRRDPRTDDVLKTPDGIVYRVGLVTADGAVKFTMHGSEVAPGSAGIESWRDRMAQAAVLHPADESIEARCDRLAHRLSEDGWHANANIAHLAGEEIRKLRRELAAR